MSGDATQDDPKLAPEQDAGSADAGGVIPVEVEAPDATAAGSGGGGEGGGTDGAEAPAGVAAPVTNPLEDKIAALEKERKDLKDRFLRAAADLENQRKRTKRELEDARFDTKGKVLKEMLPVVDNLERAIEHAGAGELDAALKPLVEGVQLVLRQFQTAFERLEITNVDAMGKPFDPNLHEAISQAESDQPPGTVVQVLQRGYKAGDRLLRPALVVVAKAKAAEE